MLKLNSFLSLKIKLFLPIASIIILIIAVATILFINNSIEKFNLQIEKSLELEVNTIKQMFERERQLKFEKVERSLNVAHKLFYDKNFKIFNENIEAEAINQETNNKHLVKIKRWTLDNQNIINNFNFIDSTQNILKEGTITIFQKIDSGFIRISTNVINDNGKRAVYTYIPNSSPVAKSINNGKTYFGRAYVVNDWYITAYEPIIYNNEIVGILYVGNKEKDLDKLKTILHKLEIGANGYCYVFDKKGDFIIHPKYEGENWKDSSLFKKIIQKNYGIIRYKFEGSNKIVAFEYFNDFELYIAASININEENKTFIKSTIISSSIIALVTIILILFFIYGLTTEKIYKYLMQLDITEKALKSSEDKFNKLFNSTGDDIIVTNTFEQIIEVNQACCINLGYNKDELLNKKISEIKTPKYAAQVKENRRKIFENEIYTFESEHVAKDGKIIPVEIISRVIFYNNEKLILSVARNIGIRKETEREILSTIIRTEERERARFAKDMHDSVGPLLSTIKLYVNELKFDNIEQIEREEYVKQTNIIVDEAISSIRTISNNLMPTVISNYGLVKAIESFCEKINKTNRISITFNKINFEKRLDKNIELILFRVISELINNTLKHAYASCIYIELKKIDNKVFISFKDDGVGFDIDEVMNMENKGMGLKNIISRIKSINGQYKFYSSPTNGFSININFDL